MLNPHLKFRKYSAQVSLFPFFIPFLLLGTFLFPPWISLVMRIYFFLLSTPRFNFLYFRVHSTEVTLSPSYKGLCRILSLFFFSFCKHPVLFKVPSHHLGLISLVHKVPLHLRLFVCRYHANPMSMCLVPHFANGSFPCIC